MESTTTSYTAVILGSGGKDMLKITRGLQPKIIIVLRPEREKSRIHLNSEGWKASLKKCSSTPLGNAQLTFGTTVTCSWQR